MSLSKEEIEAHLQPPNRQHIFERLGFQLNGEQPSAEGWIGHVLGPKELGEGESGNFALNLRTGAVKDHGRTDYSGDLYSAVQDVLGLSFPEALEWIAKEAGFHGRKGPSARSNGKKKPAWNPFGPEARQVAVYDYTDEKGRLLFESLRLEVKEGYPAHPDKTFRIRHRDAEHPKANEKGYVWGLPDAGPVLYQLPEVQAAIEREEIIYVVEGEKDVHSLKELGRAATTSPLGAGRWKNSYSEILRGADVVILPDNDGPGRRHAKKVAESLHGVAKSVRIVELPGLSEKEDVTDWLREGGTPEELQELVKAAKPYHGESPQLAPSDRQSSPRRSASKTQAQKLIDIGSEAELFHTPKGEAYATYVQDGRRMTHSIRGGAFAKWLRLRFYDAYGKPPGAQALQDAKNHLTAVAELRGEERKVFLRIAEQDGVIYIYLGDRERRAVRVDKGGWEVVEDYPVKFRHPKTMRALPVPTKGGLLGLLKRHIRLSSDEQYVLLWGWLLQALRPGSRYPVLVFTGEQGAGKTTTTRLLRVLVDPSALHTRTMPRSERDLMIAADGAWVIAFNNLSSLPIWLSDGLCRLSDGGGFATRRLHTDREEEVFFAARPVILNGIEDLTTRPDLADRAIVLELEPIPSDERKKDKELWQAFEEDRPALLGALCDALSVALARAGEVELEQLPRMAEFAEWVTAAEPAFPTEEGTFIRVYNKLREETERKTIEADVVASAICDMIEDLGQWRGKMSELSEALRPYLPDPENPPRGFPDTHQAMSGRLKRIMPALRRMGIRRRETPKASDRAFLLEKSRKTPHSP